MDKPERKAETIFRLIQFSDATFPVGAFSFSNGLETAAHIGLVHDARTLQEYVESAARQAAYSDGVTALQTFRAASDDNYERILEADRRLILFKMNEEARLMLTRMGRKLAELGARLFPGETLFSRWLEDIRENRTPGTYPAAQGIAFFLAGLDEKALFTSHQYGVINMILSAALRCLRVSHYDTQEILFRLGEKVEAAYEKARDMKFENMHAFVPELDIMASLHEKGRMRMFMN